jgi:hypothetical protein
MAQLYVSRSFLVLPASRHIVSLQRYLHIEPLYTRLDTPAVFHHRFQVLIWLVHDPDIFEWIRSQQDEIGECSCFDAADFAYHIDDLCCLLQLEIDRYGND